MTHELPPDPNKREEGKPRADLLLYMPRALREVSRLLTLALKDYDEGSWREVANGEKRYKGAMIRHILDGAIDPIDPQFGLNHDVAIATNALFSLELRLVREEGITIDIDQEDWKAIKKAASESPWMPEDYFQNDWVSDLIAFLKRNKPA